MTLLKQFARPNPTIEFGFRKWLSQPSGEAFSIFKLPTWILRIPAVAIF
jgi:hypothetical protein